MEEDKEEVKSFKDLGVCDQLIEACDNLGWKHPSKIQAEAIPHALEGKDLIGLAQTGSGKTGAFALPILQALLETPQAFFACVLSPTRELAIQIAEQFEALGSGIGVKCAVLVGGVDNVQQSIALGKRPHIVILKNRIRMTCHHRSSLHLLHIGQILWLWNKNAIINASNGNNKCPLKWLTLELSWRISGQAQHSMIQQFEQGLKFDSLGGHALCGQVLGGGDLLAWAWASILPWRKPGVATPGRLLDHLSNTKGFSLRTLKFLVLDEADRLLNEDFEKAIDELLSVIPRERNTYLYSATMTKKVRKLQRACLRNPVKIEAASKYSTVDSLKQQYLFVPAKHKNCYLVYILSEKSGSTSMVFTRTCDSTGLLAQMLRNLGLRAIPISGHMTQAKRLGALNKFKAGECNILVCTDVASRGLDIPSVDMVINYDIPSNSKDYIHRVGRTARAGRSGVAISIVSQYELEWYIQIEKLIGKKLPMFPAQEEEVLMLLERVTEAKRIADMKIKEAGGKKKRRGEDDEVEGIERYSHGKSSKKSKKR
ncbi:hypothetical protein HYC85_004644 [Camellia sinensis]|uniref:DEAD-box ATP-dependent RNA helicase 10 n=1 Tax=Camellia sinensis TaxID=4442 RepID=A0A7J7HXQ5_CAMSI|nr:hypothetical protein HYC85_004644 [Camellia sinensis]